MVDVLNPVTDEFLDLLVVLHYRPWQIRFAPVHIER